MKKIRKALFLLRFPVRTGRRDLNVELLNQHRDDAYAVMHQQLTGLR